MAKQESIPVLSAESPATFGSPGTYTILHGDAPPFAPERSVTISGTLGAPLAFLSGRGQLDDTKIHLLIDNDKGRLQLSIDDTNPHTCHVISGSLSPDVNLAKFGINTDQRWTAKSFAKFVRTMRYYFADDAEVGTLIDRLQKFEGTVTKIFKDHQSPTGDSDFQLTNKVEGIQMDRKFKLKIPLFKGYGAHTFSVEIGFDTKSTTVDLYLISDELYVLEPQIREELMAMEISKFAEYNFARVIVS